MVGDMISVIDMPGPEESIWWRGKRGFEVGFFPCECVEVIGDKVPHGLNLPHSSATLPHLTRRNSDQSDSPSEPTKSVLRKHGKLITFFRSFILSRPARGKLKKRGILRERVFGCDLGEHLLNSGNEVPKVLTHCSSFIEARGIVDGIYRLSGISSNIQRLRVAFDEDRLPDLYEDRLVLQDIHSVSSLLKMYFRELPNPVCTFHLYDKFVEAARSGDDVRLPKLRDVVSQLPPPNYRTLEYLTKHLHRVAQKHNDTGMTAKNVAIVWAPNLLRCKSLEVGGVAALQGVGVQAVVTEYLIKYCELIFSDKLPTYSGLMATGQDTPKTVGKMRPKSLAISTPTKLLSLEEARTRALINCNNIENQKYIEVGGGPENLPAKYHTVIELPGKKGGSFKARRSTAWKSIFSGKDRKKTGGSDRKISTPCELSLLGSLASSQVGGSSTEPRLASTRTSLRPVRSAESLVPTSSPGGELKALSHTHTPASVNSGESDMLGPLEAVTTAVGERTGRESPKCHSRSSSHDSYFERKQNVHFKIDMEAEEEEGDAVSLQLKPDSSLDISEIQVNFDLEDNEMKIFSEDETMMSTSVGSDVSLIRSPLEEKTSESPATGISCGVRQRSHEDLESATKSRRMSFKEKFKKFTSPPLSRKQQVETNKMVDSGVGFDSESCPGSYESGKGSKLKEKLVSALSPESMRKSEGSPKKMKSSNSPQGSSPQTIMKMSKNEDDNCEMSSLNLSPSICFIDASSSYELGGATSSETLGDCRPGSVSPTEENWCEGSETARRGEEEVIVQIHHEDDTVKGFADGPISIIGTISSNPPSLSDSESVEQITSYTTTSVFSAANTILSKSIPHSTPQFEANSESEATVNPDSSLRSEATLPDDVPPHSDATSQSENTIQSEAGNHSLDSSSRSEISLSLAAATVSENESFGLDSTNDEASTNADNTLQSFCTVEEVIGDASKVGESEDIHTRENAEADDMEVEMMRESQKATEEVRLIARGLVAADESDQMETDMTIVSAESATSFPPLRQLPSFDASSEGPTDNSNNTTDQSPGDDSSEAEDRSSLGSSDALPQEQTPVKECKHLTEEKTSSGKDCHLLSLVTDSTITITYSSLPDVVTSPPVAPPPVPQPDETKLKLSLVSPQLESVVMRRSPSSPARNRCVRSDFFSNLGDAGLPGSATDTQVEPSFSPPAPDSQIYPAEPSVMEEEEEDAKDIEEKSQGDQSAGKKSEPSPMEHCSPLQKDSPSPIAPLPSPDIGLPPLPQSSPPKPVTALAKAMLTSPQPYMKPLSGPQPYCRPSPTPRPRTSLPAPLPRTSIPEPQEFAPTIKPAPSERSLSVEPHKSSPQVFRRSLSEPPEQESIMEAVTLRLQSFSPMEEAEAESRSLELPSSSPQDGRRSTQGIPEIEKKIKFSNTEASSQFEQSPQGNRRKVKHKSSTLSLHTMTIDNMNEEENSPMLQRRNSIHNVPFVDVNDPETRTRMERYKEERRSTLRAKYKAEDYLSNAYGRKKKVSCQDTDTDTPPSPSSPPQLAREDTPPPSPPPTLRVETSHPLPLTISSATINVSRKLVDLKQPEHTFISRKSLPDNFNSTNTLNDKNNISEKKWSIGSRTSLIPTNNSSQRQQRPSELSFASSSPFQTRTLVLEQADLKNNRKNQVFKVNSAEIINMTDNKINTVDTDDIEDDVNVKERATIFGPRKTAECKVRTVSVSAAVASGPIKKPRKFSEGSATHPTSPSKIKNMAALFEQKH